MPLALRGPWTHPTPGPRMGISLFFFFLIGRVSLEFRDSEIMQSEAWWITDGSGHSLEGGQNQQDDL
jgi:hypothetical protein